MVAVSTLYRAAIGYLADGTRGLSGGLFSEDSEPVGKSKDRADSMALYFVCKGVVNVG